MVVKRKTAAPSGKASSESPAHERTPLIFISHDTRDAPLAEAFSKLLSSVSAGVLKSFRSSDKKANQGIEYGVEWYPEIMKKLEMASDVVCLLTPNSTGRPWILYEAGVAKGKLDTPVHGVALGIPLQLASSGPFAQFQNSDDSEEAVTQLVMQLVRRIPNAEPDRDVVKSQVVGFRAKALPMAAAAAEDDLVPETDAASVAKIFEEVKVMFQDLPSRIERRFDSRRGVKGKYRDSYKIIHELMFIVDDGISYALPLVMASGLVKDDFPWLYELSVEVYRKANDNDKGTLAALDRLEMGFDLTFRHPLIREMRDRDRNYRYGFEDLWSLMHEMIYRVRARYQMESKAAAKVTKRSVAKPKPKLQLGDPVR